MRFSLQRLNRRWFSLAHRQEDTIIVNKASKAERLTKILKQDKARLSTLVRLEIHFEEHREKEKTWWKGNKYAQLIKQCQSIKHIVFREFSVGQMYSYNQQSFDDDLYDSLTKLNKLESFTFFGPCEFPDMRSRTIDRSVDVYISSECAHTTTNRLMNDCWPKLTRFEVTSLQSRIFQSPIPQALTHYNTQQLEDRNSSIPSISYFASSLYSIRHLQTQLLGPFTDEDYLILMGMAPQLEHLNIQRCQSPGDTQSMLPLQFLTKLSNIKSLEFDLNLFGHEIGVGPILRQLSESETLQLLTIRKIGVYDAFIRIEDVLSLVNQVETLKLLDLSWFFRRDETEDWDEVRRTARGKGVELIKPVG